MSYTPVGEVKDKIVETNIIEDRIVNLLEKQIKLQEETNKLLKKIYNPK